MLNRMRTLNLARMRRLAKEGFWIVLGQSVTVLGSLVLVRVLTGYLTPAQYGQLALSLTIVTLFNQVVFGGIGGGIARFYAVAAEKQDLHGYLSATRQLLAYATGVTLTIGGLLLAGLAASGNALWMSIAVVATLLALLGGYNSALNGIQNAARQRAIVAFHGGLDAWLKILLAVAMVLAFGPSSTTVLIAYAVSLLLVTLSQLVFLRRTIPLRRASEPTLESSTWQSEIWCFAWPFSAWGLFTWMQQVSDRWALSFYATTRDVGLYAVVLQLGYTPIALLLGLSMTFLAPILYQRSGDATSEARNDNVHRIIWRIVGITVAVTALAVLVTGILHEWLFSLLVAPDYRGISYLLPWVVLAGGLFSTGQILSLKLMSEMKTRALLTPKVVTALLGVIMNLVGAALAGVNGMVGAMVAFSAFYLLWIILLTGSSGRLPLILEGKAV